MIYTKDKSEIIVAKFGGSSLCDAEHFLKMKEIVLSDPRRRYVVVSAPGKRTPDDSKITDLLYQCVERIEQNKDFDDIFDFISTRYVEIVEILKVDVDIKRHLAIILRNCCGATRMRDWRDYLVSRGEYINGVIAAKLLQFSFVDAFDVVHFDRNGNLMRYQFEMERRLQKHYSAVIPGFYGSIDSVDICVFSRGGSDITGALVARAVGAVMYENWTDVSGIHVVDPMIVRNPRTILELTYRELRELTYMGFPVLHDETIFPVRKEGIPIHVRNTKVPDCPGTLVVRDSENPPFSVVTGIAGRKDFTVIALEKEMMNSELGFGLRVLSVLERHKINYEHMPTGIDTMSVVISGTELDRKLSVILQEIKRECKPDSIEVYPYMALIATVGRGMAGKPNVAARLFGALAKAGVKARMIDQGSSEINIIVGVESHDFEKAIRAIYNEFFLGRGHELDYYPLYPSDLL